VLSEERRRVALNHPVGVGQGDPEHGHLDPLGPPRHGQAHGRRAGTHARLRLQKLRVAQLHLEFDTQ